MTENKTELLPCPFCGSVASMVDYAGEDGTVWQVFCTSSKCEIQPLREELETKEECIEYWNTRATVTPSDKAAALEWVDKIIAKDIDIPRYIINTIRATLQQPDDSELVKQYEQMVALIELLSDGKCVINSEKNAVNLLRWKETLAKHKGLKT